MTAPDRDARIAEHTVALQKHPLTRQIFDEFHHAMRGFDLDFFSGTGMRLEVGSGVYPLKINYPDVLATDVVSGPNIDRILDAEKMDVPDASVRCIYGQFVFHHLRYPETFFAEVERVCIPGGGIVLIDPAFGVASGFVFPRLFTTETFDRKMVGWEAPVTGPMTGANQALSGIVFERERRLFVREFPALEIVKYAPVRSYLRYIVSGGLNFPQLIPTRAAPVLRAMERLLAPVEGHLALHQFIVLRKRPTRTAE